MYNVYMPERAQGWYVCPRFGIDESSEHYDCFLMCSCVTINLIIDFYLFLSLQVPALQ